MGYLYFRCESEWTGHNCSLSVCSLACGEHGTCQGGACACDPGWGGALCDIKQCHARCHEHGQCVNGSCVCQQGWNGRHCSLDGCGGDCGGHGECGQVREPGDDRDEWRCECEAGWGGAQCGQRQETECQDEEDNDKGESIPLLSCLQRLISGLKNVQSLTFNFAKLPPPTSLDTIFSLSYQNTRAAAHLTF